MKIQRAEVTNSLGRRGTVSHIFFKVGYGAYWTSLCGHSAWHAQMTTPSDLRPCAKCTVAADRIATLAEW